jgi:hypothetical protein
MAKGLATVPSAYCASKLSTLRTITPNTATRQPPWRGFRLQAVLALMPGAALGPDDAFAVKPAAGAAAMSCMLNGPFCDVAIRSGGAEVRAHRVVLVAASPVFLATLCSS